MKKIKYIVLSLIVAFALSACNDLIKENVVSSLTDENTYTTEGGCNAALNGVYSTYMTSSYYGNDFPDVVLNGSGMFYNKSHPWMSNFTFTSSTNFITSSWASMWQTVNLANNVIFNVSKSTISTSVKNRIIGEAYFIRAKQYFELVQMWGALPLRVLPSKLDNVNSPRVPVDSIYKQIIKDLDSAKVNLPLPTAAIKGRPHVFAAYALAQRVYLTLAGNDPTSPYWQKSLDEGLEIYANKPYTLVKPYSNLWDIKNQNTTESIFEIQGSSNTGGALMIRLLLPGGNGSTLTPGSQTWGRAVVNKEVYDKHVTQYKGDPRIDACYLDSFYYDRLIPTKKINCYPVAKTGANSYTFIRKFVDPNLGSSSNCNYIYLRYADVLLALAEAENEINGPTAAYQYVNAVLERARDRNGNGVFETTEINPANWTSLTVPTKEIFRDQIMAERQYELLGECNEFFDVRRRGKAYLKTILDYHNTYAPNVTNNEYKVTTDDVNLNRIMLLPIPITEYGTNTKITQNDQNPGW